MVNINKKGLSDVVAVVLIVLLALAAIAIVWAFIQPALRGTGTAVTASQKCLAAEVKPTKCNLPGVTQGSVTVQLVKGDVPKVILVFRNPTTGQTRSTSKEAITNTLLTTTTITIDPNTGESVKAVAVIEDENGADYICPESPTEITCT